MSVYRQGPLTIRLSHDAMTAYLSLSGGGDVPSEAEVRSAIEAAGVRFGILEEVIQNLIEAGEPVQEQVIAEGQKPHLGENARLVWHVDIVEGQRPTIMADGKADFKRLKRFEWVEAGQQLVSVLPAQKGSPGTDVRGESVPVPDPVDGLELPAGKNCRISDDGLTLESAIDGYACMVEGRVQIDNVYHIRGDVDFSTGNVKYEGTVMVDGDVRSGFRVEATESIYIEGSVEAAEVYSKNGSVVVRSGILGRGRAKILAGDSLHCGFIQDATASIKNNVLIKHYSINSHITCGGTIRLTENEGLVRGGRLVAERGIEARVIGSDHAIPTEVVLSRSDVHADDAELIALQRQLAEEQQEFQDLVKREQFLRLLQDRVGKLSPDRAEELERLDEQRSEVAARLDTLQSAISQRQVVHPLEASTSVTVHQTLFRKVAVTIGHKQYYCTEPKRGVRISRRADDIVVTALHGATPGASA